MGFLLRYENVAWYEDGVVRILDRENLPGEDGVCDLQNPRGGGPGYRRHGEQSGGPYTAAAMGMALAAHEAGEMAGGDLTAYMEKAATHYPTPGPPRWRRWCRLWTERWSW